MTKTYLALILLIVAGACATPIPYDKRVAGKPGAITKHRPVADRVQAKHYIQNQINFLNFTFEQSRDPYYGTQKWSDACLKANKIGVMTETDESIEVRSTLYVSELGEVGHCPEHPKASEYFVAYYYCENSKEVVEIRIPSKLADEVGTKLCN